MIGFKGFLRLLSGLLSQLLHGSYFLRSLSHLELIISYLRSFEGIIHLNLKGPRDLFKCNFEGQLIFLI